jgi:uncharacterized surface protein with fasciclin (FAS1) repeats
LTAGALLAALALLVLLPACQRSTTDEPAATDELSAVDTAGTVVDVVESDERFSTLAAAIDSSGLRTELVRGGPFTLLAPPNTAFEALPDGTLEALLAPANRDQLTRVLRQHVLEGTQDASALQSAGSVQTLQGGTLSVRTSGDTLYVGEAAVLADGIEATNGVIHVVDAVIKPPAPDATTAP